MQNITPETPKPPKPPTRPKAPVKVAGGVRSNDAPRGHTGGIRKALKAFSDSFITAWVNSKYNAFSLTLKGGAAKDGADDHVIIEYKPDLVMSDTDGVWERLFDGTPAELLAILRAHKK